MIAGVRPSDDPLRRFVRGEIARGEMPGASWWVERPAGVVGRGAAGEVEQGAAADAVQESTPFDLASLTKPLATALMLVLLEQEGRLDLEAPLGDWLELPGATPLAGRSLLALAAHRAGLPAWAPLCAGAGDLDGYVAQIAALAASSTVEGTLYSDLGYILLGAVIERVAGGDLATLFQERIAGPAGLERLGFAGRSQAFGDAAATEQGNRYERRLAGPAGQNYGWRELIPRGQVHDANAHALGGVAGHAGLFGAAGDVARLALALTRGEPLGLGRAARDRLLRPPPPGCGRTVGMVLAAHSAAARGVLPDHACGHTGFTGTSMWLDPDTESCFVLLTNRIHPAVPEADFQGVRREFHRLAREMAKPA